MDSQVQMLGSEYNSLLDQYRNMAYRLHIKDFPFECKVHGISRHYTSTGRCKSCEYQNNSNNTSTQSNRNYSRRY